MLRDCHSYYLKLYERTRSFAVSLRQEGKVAWLESPNRLDALSDSPGLAGSKGLLATARFMVAMPIHCRPREYCVGRSIVTPKNSLMRGAFHHCHRRIGCN